MSSQPSWKMPLILAGSLAVLGPAFYWLEYSHKPKVEEQAEKAKHLFQLTDRQVESIKLRSGATTYEFECKDVAQKLCKPGDNSKWELTAPTHLRGDDSSVNGLLSALNNLVPIESIDLGDETPQKRIALLSEYKLEAAARAPGGQAKLIELKFADGKSFRVYFGGAHPISDGIFAAAFMGDAPANEKLVGTTIDVIPSYFKANFDHDLTYWRDKRILSINASQVKRFELNGTHGLVSGTRKDSSWILGGDLPGDIENVDALLTAAAFLTAREFSAESKESPEGKKMLASATRFLTLTLYPEKAEDQVTLTLYRKGKGDDSPIYVTATGRDAIYGLDGSANKRLDKSYSDLRLQKLMSSTDRFGTKRIEASGKSFGKAPLVVTQGKDGKWSRAGGTGAFNGDRPGQLLERLSGNRIQAFLTGKDIPTGEKDGIRITFVDEKGGKLRDIAFWQVKAASLKQKVGPGSDQIYARDLLSPRPEAFRVDPQLKDALPWTADYFAQSGAPGGAPADAKLSAHGHGDQNGLEDEHDDDAHEQ